MSSWMNRGIPRRRDLSQIPEELRPPAPIPRVERTEVIHSELYQPIPSSSSPFGSDGSPFFSMKYSMDNHNQVFYPASSSSSSSSRSSSELSSLLSSLSTQYSGILPTPSTSKELSINDKSYIFVILRNIRDSADNDLWIACYNSIRQYYTNKIIIIDDNSAMNTVNGRLDNTDIIYSDFAGAGETLPYYYFLMHRWADRMIFLHDTMSLYRPFRPDEIDTNARFHWFFTNTDNLTVSRLEQFLPSLSRSNELLPYCKQPDKWKACFGVAMIIDLQIVEQLEEKYKLFSTMVMMIRNRKDREMAERALGIVLFHEKLISSTNCSNFGDILYHPWAFDSSVIDIKRAKYLVEQSGYQAAIMKLWRGR